MPLLDAKTNKPNVDLSYDNDRNIFGPTPTPETETLPGNIQTHTKIGRFPQITNLLLNGGQNKHSVEIEQFCTTGFDCGNGVCLSSEKVRTIFYQRLAYSILKLVGSIDRSVMDKITAATGWMKEIASTLVTMFGYLETLTDKIWDELT